MAFHEAVCIYLEFYFRIYVPWFIRCDECYFEFHGFDHYVGLPLRAPFPSAAFVGRGTWELTEDLLIQHDVGMISQGTLDLVGHTVIANNPSGFIVGPEGTLRMQGHENPMITLSDGAALHDVTILQGTLDANGYDIDIKEDWTNRAQFVAMGGRVNLNRDHQRFLVVRMPENPTAQSVDQATILAVHAVPHIGETDEQRRPSIMKKVLMDVIFLCCMTHFPVTRSPFSPLMMTQHNCTI